MTTVGSDAGVADPAAVQEACGALFAQLRASGVAHVAVSPGSRSTPLTCAADATDGLGLTIHLDERSAGFFALGLARATDRPVALVCTSGSAAANYLPAVVEAFHSGIPLVVLTADRPPELQGRGAPQTIDQVRLYGSHVRLFRQAPVGGTADPAEVVALTAEAVAASLHPVPGPVHLNCPFREPLEPSPAPLPPVDTVHPTADHHSADIGGVRAVAGLFDRERGLIAAGPMDLDPVGAEAVARLAAATGWPILADPASGLRHGPHVSGRPVLANGEALLAAGLADRHPPDVVLQLGGLPTSRSYRLWMARAGTGRVVSVDRAGRFPDPSFAVTDRVPGDPGRVAGRLLEDLMPRGATAWTTTWTRAEEAAAAAVAGLVKGSHFDEPAVVASLSRALPPGSNLFVSNSMPIRDLDAFLPVDADPLRILANRGANGIDGQVSTAMGMAHGSSGPSVLFTGDLALLHDLSGLVAARRLGVDLTVVVVDNDGGGIFSLLPIADRPGIDHHRLFHTPHGLDLGLAAPLAGATLHRPRSRGELDSALAVSIGRPGLHLVHVRTVASTNVDLHRRAAAAVAAAVGGEG